LHLVTRVGVKLVDFSVHDIDVGGELLAVVLKLLKAHLERRSLIVTFEHFLLCLSDANLTHFILLLQVDNQFVLPLDYCFILFYHFLGLLALALILGIHIAAHVVKGAYLLVQARDLVVFDDHQLVEFVNLFLGVARLSLVALEH